MKQILFFTVLIMSAAEAAQKRIYIGTYTRGDSQSDGIYTCLFDDQSGTLSTPELAVACDNPSFLAVHPQTNTLYACNETNDFGGEETGAISAFRIDQDKGGLSLLNQKATGGGAPCHLNVSADGRFVLVANYLGGNASVFPVNEDGTLGDSTCLINHVGKGPNAQRQEAPHAHSINLSSDNRFAYVADLGTDRIMIYRFDGENGRLVPSAADSVSVSPGGGPRHFSIHPKGLFAYANNELTSEAVFFRRDIATGNLSHAQSISTLPPDYEGRRSTAECLVHPSGRFLFVSNRGHDSIVSYRIDPSDGQLTLNDITGTGGREPRNFFITPGGRWLLAENQNSDTVNVFAVDLATGKLTETGNRISVAKPVCIRMLP